MGWKAASFCAAVSCGGWVLLGHERFIVTTAWVAITVLEGWAFLTNDTHFSILINTFLMEVRSFIHVILEHCVTDFDAKVKSAYPSTPVRGRQVCETRYTREQTQPDAHTQHISTASEPDVSPKQYINSQAVSTSSTPTRLRTPIRRSPSETLDLHQLSKTLERTFSNQSSRRRSPSIVISPADAPSSSSTSANRRRPSISPSKGSFLSAQRSVSMSRRSTYSQQQSPSRSLRSRSSSTPEAPATPDSKRSRTSSIGYQSPHFQPILIENGVIFDQHLLEKPANFRVMQHMLERLDPAQSSTNMRFDYFSSQLDKVKNEPQFKSLLQYVLMDDKILARAEVSFSTNFESLDSHDRITKGRPDFLDGESPQDVREHLGLDHDWKFQHDIWASLNPSAALHVSLPNFFIELKGPRGDPDECKRQVFYYGAVGARAIHKTRHHLNKPNEDLFDGMARTITVSIHPRGLASFYATHVKKLSLEDGSEGLEYHSTLLRAFKVQDEEDYERWTKAVANAYNWAKEMRSSILEPVDQSSSASRSPKRTASPTPAPSLQIPRANTPPPPPQSKPQAISLPLGTGRVVRMILLRIFALIQQVLVLFLVTVLLCQLYLGRWATPAVVMSAIAPSEPSSSVPGPAPAAMAIPAEPIHVLGAGLTAAVE